MRYLSLFSGIGGMDLGLDRAGFECVGQVEIDPFCRAVLAKHWPGVKRMEDVRTVRGDEFGPVDLVCGGVPCQPASCAGKRKGASDDRWLWPDFIRIVRGSGCSWFLAENVRGFLSLPVAGGVVRELEGAGYEVRTLLLGAHHVGAPHRRDRIWIVGRLADASSQRRQQIASGAHGNEATNEGRTTQHDHQPERHGEGDRVADAARGGLRANRLTPGSSGHAHECGADMADTKGRDVKGMSQRRLNAPKDAFQNMVEATGRPDPESSSTIGKRRDWYTPNTDDRPTKNKGRNLGAQIAGSLNPVWVTQLMGFPEGWLTLSEESLVGLMLKSKSGGGATESESPGTPEGTD